MVPSIACYWKKIKSYIRRKLKKLSFQLEFYYVYHTTIILSYVKWDSFLIQKSYCKNEIIFEYKNTGLFVYTVIF